MASKIKEAFYPQEFDFEHMMSLRTFRDKIGYVAQSLSTIGSGTSRTAFLVDGATVLKVAKNRAGLSQSLEEIKLGQHKLNCCANVYDYSKNGVFLEMERVVGFEKYATFYPSMGYVNEKDAFSRFTNMLPMSLSDILVAVLYDDDLEQTILEMGQYENGENWELPEHAKAWIRDVYDLMRVYNNKIGDLDRPDHWGWVYRNKILTPVCIDYGFTEEVSKKHYNQEYMDGANSRSEAPAIQKGNALPVVKAKRNQSYWDNHAPDYMKGKRPMTNEPQETRDDFRDDVDV